MAVTASAVVLAAAAGASATRSAVAAAAVLAGQLSVGWANDWLDADRDRAVDRVDKPIVAGDVPVGVVRAAAIAALVAAVTLTALLGWAPLAAHTTAIAAAWAYNAGLKTTWASPLPYAAAFGLLPPFVAAVAGGRAPAWMVGAAALLGAGAHFTNAVGDLAADRATGVRGLPQRLGGRLAMTLAGGLLGGGLAVAAAGAAAAGRALPTAGIAAAALMLATAVGAGVSGHGRAAFRLTLVGAAAVVGLVAVGAVQALGEAG